MTSYPAASPGLLPDATGTRAGEPSFSGDDARLAASRREMTCSLRRRGVRNEGVLNAIAALPRHRFVPESLKERAYEDAALPIEDGQTISQPYVVALMTQALDPKPGQRILEVGTGSGYQAAILSLLGARVVTLEIIPGLARASAKRIASLGIPNVAVRNADGDYGWPLMAPYDGILVACAAPRIPSTLVDQLKPGGCMVIPLESSPGYQKLTRVVKLPDGRHAVKPESGVVFVPMTGRIRGEG